MRVTCGASEYLNNVGIFWPATTWQDIVASHGICHVAKVQ
ncbi:hypothetical protein PanWU01x14_064150 [Parasponia andersonii]|uniref:Uncharacterized protein n=1 Tax=Parasponia andersonii TaxID=3476 RepID=A0A2P5DH72_PARAD|nr:hypothetical protein PanWU01x14_064150 [Parasponia andersonii]